MNKIYVVTEGCYSEYHIDKIFSTREAAEQYCALQNASNTWSLREEEQQDCDFWDYEYRVEEYPLDDVQVLAIEQPMKKRYVYTFCDGREHLDIAGVIYEVKNSVHINTCKKNYVRVSAVLDYEMPVEKVKKIIYDEIARYKAVGQ